MVGTIHGRLGTARSSIALIATLVFATSLLLSPSAHSTTATRGLILTSPSLATLAAGAQPRNLTFYLHNNTIGVNVNGVTTPFIFDTLQKFGKNNTVSKIQTVRQDWRLYPVLAGPFSLNGSVALHLFVSIDLVGAQITPSLTLSEVNASGGVPWTYTLTAGSQAWWTTPHDLALATPALQHMFASGSTIEVVATITSGVRMTTIWYNASWVPSHIVLPSDDFARVHDLSFLDPSGNPRQRFDPLAANQTIRIRANVTDPLGGYDIHWVNLTLIQPGGATILNAVPMTQISGTPISFLSTYQVSWSYAGRPAGRYNATASVVDQSGFYNFEATYTTAGFIDSMDSFFYVGGLPLYVNVEAVDSKSATLGFARVTLVSGGIALDAHTASAAGTTNFTMAVGNYTFQVSWQGIVVASLAYTAVSNVSAASPLVITTSVYYPVFQADDANGKPLADASIVFLHPNGTLFGPLKTNVAGDVDLSQVPAGTYGLKVAWRGVDVFTGTETVSSNGVIAFQTAVYELKVNAVGGNGQALPGAFVSVVDSTGLVFDAGLTGADGSVVLRLPGGNYTIEAQYITDQLGTLYNSGVREQNVSLTGSTTATIRFADFPLPITGTLAFLFAVVYAATVAALLIVFFLIFRRRGAGKKEPQAEEKKE